MYCTKCGAQLKENQKFCVKCGAKALTGTAPTPPPAQTRPATQPVTPATPAPTPSSQQPQKPEPTGAAPDTTAATQPPVPPRSPARSQTPSQELKAVPRVTGSAPALGRTKAAQGNLMWIWFGVVFIALGAGGYFSYRWTHRKAEQRPSAAQANPLGKAPMGSSIMPKASAGTASLPSTTPRQPRGSAEVASNSAARAPLASIRKVDFRNFEYHSDPLRETVRVTNGRWWGPKNGNPSGNYFGVAQVRYGEIEGSGADDAVVWTESAFGGMSPNARQAEIFVFSPSATGPRLLEGLWSSDVGKGDGVDWGRLTDVRITGHELAISYLEAQCNACDPDWSVLVTLSWNGTRFARTGLIRKPYAQTQNTVSQGSTAPEPGVAPQPQPKFDSGGTWGFQSQSRTAATGANTAGNRAVAPPPPPVESPPSTPPPATPRPRPAIASSGTLVWSGHMEKNTTITIQGSSASSGTLEGQLPGVPVMIQVSPADIAVAESPSPLNGWKEVVLRGSKSQNVVVRIQWKSLQQ